MSGARRNNYLKRCPVPCTVVTGSISASLGEITTAEEILAGTLKLKNTREKMNTEH